MNIDSIIILHAFVNVLVYIIHFDHSRTSTMKIAVEGCGHGCLNKIYQAINEQKVELLIMCGDFQSVRNAADMQCLSVPPKYRRMGDFRDYYTGKKRAPVFTIFIGGNHEASNYLDELKYGGFVAPNIYYLGRTGSIWYKGLRIVGWSGIYNGGDFMKLRPESNIEYDDRRIVRSMYHYRKDDYLKMRFLKQCNKSILLSHDWPNKITEYGDTKLLLRRKPFFKKDIQHGELGSPANQELLDHLKPLYYFAAHLHVVYRAKIDWNKKRFSDGNDSSSKRVKTDLKAKNINEIELDISDLEMENGLSAIEKSEPRTQESLSPTNFLALDKCLSGRQYVEVLNVPLTNSKHPSTQHSNPDLYLDPEYIAVMKSVNKHYKDWEGLNYEQILKPSKDFEDLVEADTVQMLKIFDELDSDEYDRLFAINEHSFVQTADPKTSIVQEYQNPQTEIFKERFS